MKRLRSTLCAALILATLPSFASELPKPALVAEAAEHQDLAELRQLIESKANLNATQPDGMTALHWAVYLDNVEAAKLLVKAGADVKATNRYGVAPLSLACLNGNASITQLLLDAGADPNTEQAGGETALMTAARTGKPGPVKALIAAGATVEATERRGQTALMWAAAEGHAEVIQILIEAGADPNAKLRSGFTPIFFAVREGKTEVVRALLSAGVDVNSPFDPEQSNNKAPNKGTSPLILAIENGHFELAGELLKAGADPNDQRSGFSPLHNLTWVRKPNRGDDDSGDPAPIGSGNLGSLQLVHKLVEHGADVNLRLERNARRHGRLNHQGMTPFMMTCDTADIPYMKVLLELGADPAIPNASKSTPLMAAAGLGTHAPGEEAGTEEEALEAVKLLLDLGLDINAVDRDGETAMHGAAYASFPAMAKFLDQHGANIKVWHQKNKRGWTPLLIAQGFRPGNFKPETETIAAISEIMLKHGVTPPPPPARTKGKWEE